MAASRLPRFIGATLLALVMLTVSVHDGQAQIFVSGYTNGLFCAAGPTCVNPNTSAYQIATLTRIGTRGNPQRLRYVNSQFSGSVPNGGQLDLTNPAAPLASQNVNNFGAFHLGGGNVTYISPFTLWVNFVNPTTNTLVFAGQVTGTITGGHGNVVIDFDPNQQGFTFNTGRGWASITVNVNDPTVPAEGSTAVTGYISAHVSPEPVTMSLIGTGLIGLAGAARRRRRKQA